MGRTTSSVVPGYVVDSNTTRRPGSRWRPTTSAAARTIDRSGVRSVSGVGTQITRTWARESTTGSAENSPNTALSTAESETSTMYDRPDRSRSIFLPSTSNPRVSNPALPAAISRGSPT